MALSRVKAIKAQCSHCNGFYADGREDCLGFLCPLYAFMPHRDKKNKPILWWINTKVLEFGKAYYEAKEKREIEKVQKGDDKVEK